MILLQTETVYQTCFCLSTWHKKIGVLWGHTFLRPQPSPTEATSRQQIWSEQVHHRSSTEHAKTLNRWPKLKCVYGSDRQTHSWFRFRFPQKDERFLLGFVHNFVHNPRWFTSPDYALKHTWFNRNAFYYFFVTIITMTTQNELCFM